MRLDIQQLFTAGYAVCKIDTTLADYLLTRLQSEVFHPHTGTYSGVQPPEIVSWSNDAAPAWVREFWHSFAESEYLATLPLYWSKFSFFKMSAHRYQVSQGLGWHHDFHEATTLNHILYLSEDPLWHPSYGGTLKVGKWSVDHNAWGDPNSVHELAEILTVHGRCVTILNNNPVFCHSVTPLTRAYSRFSLICRMGYSENRNAPFVECI